MNGNQQYWKKCKKCGSYLPAEWSRCGRCGHSVHASKSVGKIIKLILLVCVVAIVYFNRGNLLSAIGFEDKQSVIDFILGKKTVDEGVGSRPQNTVGPTLDKTQDPSSPPNSTKDAVVDAHSTESAYALIHKALASAAAFTIIPSTNESKEVFAMIKEIVLNEPEIMFYESCSYRSDGYLTFKYSKSKEFIKKASEEVGEKADQIISDIIKPGMSDFDKELAIHDYIVNNCRYDYENLNADTIPPESHNTYGVLINEIAVCEGYAKAMKLLLDRAGVESLVVIGQSKTQLHAWNMVKIEGAYYHVDATWDDPVSEGGVQSLQHTYFNLPDNEISADHIWEEVDYPKCENTAYNYFTYRKQVVSSSDELTQYLINSVKNGNNHISIRIVNYTPSTYNVSDIIQKIANILSTGASYSINEEFGVLVVSFE